MIHPIPSGTRDVLPDEMRELRAITEALRSVFDARGYGEIYTPALEYAAELDPAGAPPAYRLFDEQGEPLVLRTDMTVPIARVVGTRYGTAELPPALLLFRSRLSRRAPPARAAARVPPGGIELVGSPAPEGTAEALGVLCAALDAAGLRDYRVGLGDASLYPSLLDAYSVEGERARASSTSWPHATSWGWSASSAGPVCATRWRRCSCAPAAARRRRRPRGPRGRWPTPSPACGPCRRCCPPSRPRA